MARVLGGEAGRRLFARCGSVNEINRFWPSPFRDSPAEWQVVRVTSCIFHALPKKQSFRVGKQVCAQILGHQVHGAHQSSGLPAGSTGPQQKFAIFSPKADRHLPAHARPPRRSSVAPVVSVPFDPHRNNPFDGISCRNAIKAYDFHSSVV
jgi:hypothetical protein